MSTSDKLQTSLDIIVMQHLLATVILNISIVIITPSIIFIKILIKVVPQRIFQQVLEMMIKAMSREVARFVQSRFGELKISEARYEDLLGEADMNYPRYLNMLQSIEYVNLRQDS